VSDLADAFLREGHTVEDSYATGSVVADRP